MLRPIAPVRVWAMSFLPSLISEIQESYSVDIQRSHAKVKKNFFEEYSNSHMKPPHFSNRFCLSLFILTYIHSCQHRTRTIRYSTIIKHFYAFEILALLAGSEWKIPLQIELIWLLSSWLLGRRPREQAGNSQVGKEDQSCTYTVNTCLCKKSLPKSHPQILKGQ